MFNNNKTSDWLKDSSADQLECLIRIARTNMHNWIKNTKNAKKLIFNSKLTIWKENVRKRSKRPKIAR